jgi:hypothetical protein
VILDFKVTKAEVQTDCHFGPLAKIPLEVKRICTGHLMHFHWRDEVQLCDYMWSFITNGTCGML